MKCLIVDDNKLALMTLKQMAIQSQQLTVAGECSNGLEAFNFLQHHSVDILFLDVEMPEMTGIELIKSLTYKPIVILTTSNKDYAAEAYELSVADYLVKPFTLPRFMQTIQKASDLLQRKDAELSTVNKDYIFVKENKAVKKISVNEILWIEAMGDYVKLQMDKKTHIVHTTLRLLEEKLDPAFFIRVHRSYMVPIDKINYIEEGIIYIGTQAIPLAETYKNALNKRLNPI